MCHVIISDHVVERRMSLLLNAADFEIERLTETDALLAAFQDHPVFTGCKRWLDLDIVHFHALIINMLKICADQPPTEAANQMPPLVVRLSLLLCSLINLIQRRTGSVIELLRVNRIGADEVLYDYSARLDIVFVPPKTGLRVVIDNA